METLFYKNIFHSTPFGFAYHKIITNTEGVPVDYEFLEVNKEFERLTGMKAKEITNRKFSEVFDRKLAAEFNWVEFYGKIALNGSESSFEQYSDFLQRWYKIHVFAPEKYYFTTLFQDVTKEKVLSEASKYFMEYNDVEPDYERVCNDIMRISKARYAVFNLFNLDGSSFRTVAYAGVGNHMQKAARILGFDVLEKNWAYDPNREQKTKHNIITRFENLRELTGQVIPSQIVKIIENTFNLGEIALVRIMKDDRYLGDFTLLFKKGDTLAEANALEMYARQTAMFIDKLNTQTELNRFFSVNIDLFCIVNFNNIFIKLNPAWEEVLGYNMGELKEKRFLDFVHPDDVEPSIAIMSKLSKQQKIDNFINRYRSKDGTYRYFEWSAQPVGDLVYAAARDITSHILTKNSLKESQEQNELISKYMGSVITMLDTKMNLLYVSPSIEKFTGFKPEEYQKKKLHEIMTPASYAYALAVLKEEMAAEASGKANPERTRTIELEQLDKAGKSIWTEVTITFIRDSRNQIISFLCVAIDIGERKEAEEKLKKSEEKYRNLVENSLDIVYTLNLNGMFTFISHAFYHLLGHETTSIIGYSYKDLLHPDDIGKCEDFLNKALETEQRQEGIEFRLKHADGTWRWFTTSGMVMRDSGKIVGLEGIARDITNYKRSKQTDEIRFKMIDFAAAHSLDEVLRQALDYVGTLVGSPIAFYHFLSEDQKTLTLQQWSTATTDIFCKAEGKGSHYAIDKAGVWTDCIALRKPVIHNSYASLPHKKGLPEGHAEVVRELVVPVFRKNKIVAILGVGNKSSDYDHEDVETVSYLANVTWEIIERKKAEMQLVENERKYRLITENTSDVIWVLNLSKNKFTYISPSVYELRGITPEEAIEEGLENSMPAAYFSEVSQLIAENVHKIQNKEAIPERFVFQLQQYHKNGSLIWIESTVKYRFNTEGEIELTGVSRNIESRKKIQNELIKAKEVAESASKAKSVFLANMSHEIRTPLNGVIGFSELLTNTPLNSIQNQYVENINTSAQTLLGVISDILDFSKIEAGKLDLDFVKTDIITLTEQASDKIKLQVSRKNLEFLLDIPASIPRLAITDPVRLKQMLVNLLSNAVKFTDSGEIELKLEFSKISDTEGKYCFSVRDTGIGISETDKSKLFKAFSQADTSTTRKYGGTGLGLIISNHIARKLGSDIEVESKPGEGSTFKFCFNTQYEYSEKQFSYSIEHIRHVLVIDDNDKNRMILEHMLSYWGIKFTGCDNGLAALNILEKQNDFDVLVVDYQMPYMDGLETIKLIKNRIGLDVQKQPVILLHSSIDDSKVRDECKKLGIRFNIIKPVKSSDLFDYLNNIFEPEYLSKQDKQIQAGRMTQNSNSLGAQEHIILVAEDVPLNLEVIRALLHNILPASRILTAKNGRDVLDILKEHTPAAILMDIQMPVMDGYEATRIIRKNELKSHKHIPIIALTAGATKEEMDKCKEAGMDDFIAKPLEKNILLEILKKHLSKKKIIKSERIKQTNKSEETLAHFNKIKLDQLMGGEELIIHELIIQSLNQIPKLLQELENVVYENEPDAIKKIAHTIKGTALNMCFEVITAICIKIEESPDNPEIVIKKYRELMDEWEIVNNLLKK